MCARSCRGPWLHFELGGKGGLRFTAQAGDHVLKPRGISRGFWNVGSETARYVETSGQDGFERFVDGRKDGLAAMVSSGASELETAPACAPAHFSSAGE